MTITESIIQHGWTQKAYIHPSTGAMCMTAHAAESAGVDFSELEHSRQGEAITRLLVRTAPPPTRGGSPGWTPSTRPAG